MYATNIKNKTKHNKKKTSFNKDKNDWLSKDQSV